MITLTLTAIEAEVYHTASGENVAQAGIKLLADLYACYDDVIPEVFEGIAELGKDGEGCFKHFDFSMPEESFTLEIQRSS